MGKKQTLIYLINGGVVFTLLLISFSFTGMWPFGDNSIAAVDLSSQYLGFYDYFANVLNGSEGLFYSFNKGLGGGMFALWAYYLMSPFNFVYAFFNGEAILQGVQIVYVLKMVSLSLTATHYFKRKGLEDIYNTMFTLGWVFSGYIMMFRVHLMWVDALIYLPLLILELEDGLQTNKYGKYILLLTVTIYSNYYIGYMVGLFTIIYALYRYYTKEEGQPIYLVGYIKGCILSGILSLWVLIPTAYSMVGGLRTSKIDDLFFNYYPANFFSVLRFVDTSNIGYRDGAPLLMFGTALVFYLLVVLRHTTKKQKIAYGVVALFYLLTFTIRPLGRVWTIGQDETWYIHRSAFTFVWFNIAFLANNKQYLKQELSRLQALLLTGAWMGTSIFIFLQEGAIYSIIGVVTFIFALFYGVIINLRFRGKEFALVGILAFEVLAMLVYQGIFIGTTEINEIESEQAKQQETMELIKKEKDEMSRIYHGFYKGHHNNGFTLGESTVTHTSSTIGENVRYLYNQVGVIETYSFVGVAGMNGIAAALLNVEYVDTQFNPLYQDYIKDNPQFEQITDTVYYNKARLGLGYTISERIESVGRAINFNGITGVLTGDTYAETVELEVSDSYNVEIDGDTYTIIDDKDEAYVTYTLTDDVNYVYKDRETVPGKAKGKEGESSEGQKYDGSQVQGMYGNFINTVKDDGSGEYRYQIKFDEVVKGTGLKQPVFYSINMEKFVEDIQKYYDTHSSFTLTEQGRGTLTGTVNNQYNDPYLQLSVPYEKGWTVTVNGKKQEVLNSMDYLAVSIPEGESEVEFVYHTPLLRESVVVSLALAIVFVGGDALYAQRKRKKQEDTSHKLDDGNQTM